MTKAKGNSTTSKTLCIVYGFAEGERVGAKMRNLAQEKGYTVTKDVLLADVLVAHSGGCYLLPTESNAKEIILVDPPFWPGRHPLHGLLPKIRREQKDFAWLVKTFYDFWYFVIKLPHWFRMSRAVKSGEINYQQDASVILVRNKDDDFTHPKEVVDYATKRGWALCSMEGQHDDLWLKPAKYLDLLDN